MHGSQVVMRCSLQMVHQWTSGGAFHSYHRKASLMNGDFYKWYHWLGFLDDWYLFVYIGLSLPKTMIP